MVRVADVYHDTISEHKDGLTHDSMQRAKFEFKAKLHETVSGKRKQFLKGGENSECHNDNPKFSLFVPLN